MSQISIFAADDLGFETDFSTRVQSLEGKQIAVDRTMMWPMGMGNASGAHNSIGLPYLSNRHYLPEGSSAWGFDCWICIQNPCAVDAHVKLTYMTQSGPVSFDKVVPGCGD
ncbi:MAG: hypothetical protein KKF41_15890 [Actinobacteria bacterium]|nr:hypothetical protein [Actinomycetota bacterium]MBU1944507.1 hypothetical protein [Actinomycetota bacterium]MBU2689060.1 hypothetical protein [Actinomycetota bacterium]